MLGMLTAVGHFVHDIITYIALVSYLLAIWSGFQTLRALGRESVFKLPSVLKVCVRYLKASLTGKAIEFDPDTNYSHCRYSILWIAVNISTIACIIFFVKNVEYIKDGSSRILGLEWAWPWALAHLLASTGGLLFHASIHVDLVTKRASKNNG